MRWCLAPMLVLACLPNPAFDDGEEEEEEDEATASSDSGAVTEAAVAVGELRVAWTTPEQIRWQWAPSGEADQLARYELVTGPTEQDVLERSAAAVVWTPETNPELARFHRPKTTGVDLVEATVTDRHAPDTVYFAQLTAYDSTGRSSASNVAQARTQEAPVGEIVVFADEPLVGYSIPAGIDISNAGPFAGDAHYRYIADCEGEPDCFIVLKRQGFGIDLSAVTEGNFATTAYLELALAVSGSTPPWWSEIWVWYRDPDSTDDSYAGTYVYSPFTARVDGQYHVWQVPLREFDGARYEDLAQGLYMFAVSGRWTNGAVIDIDEVRIRW